MMGFTTLSIIISSIYIGKLLVEYGHFTIFSWFGMLPRARSAVRLLESTYFSQ